MQKLGSSRSPPIVLIGNKTDLNAEREVEEADGLALARSWGLPKEAFCEISAKSNEEVAVNNIYSLLHSL